MGKSFDQIVLFKIGNIPINSTIFWTWIIMAILTILSYLITRKIKPTLYPSKSQALLEIFVSLLQGEVQEISGDSQPHKYMGLVCSLFFFILFANLLSVFPYYQPPTASLSTTFACAGIVFLAIPYFAVKNAGVKAYFKKFTDPTPLMLPMNVFSDCSSTMAMALRLYGNMFSGVLFTEILMIFSPFILPLPIQILGLLTGSIQAYIFVLLAVVYTSGVSQPTPTDVIMKGK